MFYNVGRFAELEIELVGVVPRSDRFASIFRDAVQIRTPRKS
jgi:hypothetical protein